MTTDTAVLADAARSTAGAACWAHGLTLRYPVRGRRRTTLPAPRPAIDSVDLVVPPGEVFGLLGPNGAGKTTLVRLLTGLLRPDAGTIRLQGQDVTGQPRAVARVTAYLAQSEPALDDLTVSAAVVTTGRLRGLSRTEAARSADGLLNELGLTPLADRPLRRLSGGQRQLGLLATALVGDRPLLVLDEPTAGLDTEARRTVWAALRRRRVERGTTVILVTHNVVEAEHLLDRVAVLDAGHVIACDTPGRLKARVDDTLRLRLVWRTDPPYADAAVAALRPQAEVDGRRWTLRLPPEQARAALSALTTGPALTALDDFTLTTPSLEDVYLALGGRAGDLERQ